MTSGIDPWDLGPPSIPLPDPPPVEESTKYTPASSSPVITKQIDDLTPANGPTSMAPMATKTFNELLLF